MKLLSGMVELKPGWFVRLPRPMTWMEMAYWRFGPLAIPLMGAMGGGALAGGTIAGVGLTATPLAGMSIASAALLGGGLGMQVAGQLQAGRAAEAQMTSAQRMADYNARLQEREAKIKRQEAGFAQVRQAARGARIKSALTARLGAAGGLISPVAGELVEAQARELELENAMIGYMGETAAMRAESQAELDRLQGKIYGKRGRAARRASYYRAGSTLLQGFG